MAAVTESYIASTASRMISVHVLREIRYPDVPLNAKPVNEGVE